MRSGIIAKKIGMSNLYTQSGTNIPVTVLHVENCKIIDDTKISYEVLGKCEKNIIFLDQNIELISIKIMLSFFLISFVFFFQTISVVASLTNAGCGGRGWSGLLSHREAAAPLKL